MQEPTFLILTALADQPRHGYGIIQAVTDLSGDVTLLLVPDDPATFAVLVFLALAGLTAAGLTVTVAAPGTRWTEPGTLAH